MASIQEKINTALATKTQAVMEHKAKEQAYLHEQQERLEAIQQLEDIICSLYAMKLAETKPKPVKLTGVTRVGEKWKAVGLKSHYLGTYDTEKEAAEKVDEYYKSLSKTPRHGFNSEKFAQLNL